MVQDGEAGSALLRGQASGFSTPETTGDLDWVARVRSDLAEADDVTKLQETFWGQ